MSEYTQGVCHDGAAILKDGQPLTIEQILEGLRERDALKDHAVAVAAAVGYDDSSAYQFNASVQATCINNVKRFAEHLHAIEREFFMVPGEPDEDYPDAEPDDCTVCMGTGYDHIKNNKEMPCGGCYGLGKVREDGEAPAEMWELATVATKIITRQEHELRNLRRIAQNPAVQALIDQQRQHAIDESTARQEQEWRRGKGHGPHGQRHTGD